MINILYNIFTKMLHILPAEKSHNFAVFILKNFKFLIPKNKIKKYKNLETNFFNMKLTHPIGLAAGFDKNAQCYTSLAKLGFSFVEVGTIVPNPQPGNPQPRLFRLAQDKSIINRFGFNSYGVQKAKQSLKQSINKNIGVNIGMNKDCTAPEQDYATCAKNLKEFGKYFVINVSSPNTKGLRNLQQEEHLLKIINSVKPQLKSKPLLIKISPDEENIKDFVTQNVIDLIDGIIISNTTVSRDNIVSKHKEEVGGMSGMALKNKSDKMLKECAKIINKQIPIIASGGVFTGQDAFDKICFGASCVQIYSSFIYNGPSIINKINKELSECIDKNNFDNIEQAIGCKIND